MSVGENWDLMLAQICPSIEMEARLEARIYVGNLPKGVRHSEVEDLFVKYGKINYLDIKDGQTGSYGFIEFDSVRDAEDAVAGRDGYDFDGYRLRVEFCRGGRGKFNDDYRGSGSYSGSSSYSRGYGGRYPTGGGSSRGYPRRRPGPPSRRTEYRLLVSNLPMSGSWQDLKDHMREAGDVCYADVYRDGTGVVEFVRYEGLKYAVKHLDDSKFRSHEGDTSYIRVRIDPSCRAYSYSRSRSNSADNRYHSRSSRRRYSNGSPGAAGDYASESRRSRQRRASDEYSRSPRSPERRYGSPADYKGAAGNEASRRSYRSSRSRSPISPRQNRMSPPAADNASASGRY